MESRLGGSTFRPDEDSKTDESKDFLWTRLQFKVNRLGTSSATCLEPLRDKWVTFTIEMNRQAPSGLSFVMYPTRGPGYPWRNCRWFYDAGPGFYAMRPQPVCVKAGAGLTSKAWTTNSLQLQMGEPYDYITGFLPTNSTWKWASLGTMPSRKTRLRSSLECAFVQRPSSWASRAHRRSPVPVAGPAHRSDGCS